MSAIDDVIAFAQNEDFVSPDGGTGDDAEKQLAAMREALEAARMYLRVQWPWYSTIKDEVLAKIEALK